MSYGNKLVSAARFPVILKGAVLLAISLLGSRSAGAICTGPPNLLARVSTHPDAKSYIELGTWFGDHNQYACAIEAYNVALKYDPRSGQVLYLIGLSFYSAGRTDDAVDPLKKSIQAVPGVLAPHLVLGASLAKLKRDAEAEIQWQEALQIDPTSLIALDRLSNAWIDGGDSSSAIALLLSVPRDEDLTLDLARAYTRSSMTDDAVETLTEALQKTPTSIRLTDALVTAYVTKLRYSEAVKIAEICVQLNPGKVEAQRIYLRALTLNKETDIALPLAQKLLASAPHDFSLLFFNGVLEREVADYPAARTHLQEAVALNPNHYNARYNLGCVLARLQDYKGAKVQLEKAIALGASEPEVHFELAAALRSIGETEQAKTELKIYQQLFKQKSDRTQAAIKSAQAAKEPDPKASAALYREAFEALPQDAMLAYKLAMALDRTGDTAGEMAALEQAVQIDSGMAVAHNQLGYLTSRNGDAAAAEKHFRLAVKAAPGYAQAWISLAATLSMLSRVPEAQEALAHALKIDPTNADALQLNKDLSAAQVQH